jgi:4-hydroxybenzoate polyprenyltransferase
MPTTIAAVRPTERLDTDGLAGSPDRIDGQNISGAPICVDLDGTLVRTDTLVEGLLALGLGRRFLQALLLLFGRRAAFKAFVAQHAEIDPALLPYNEELLLWLCEQKAIGRRLVLATAADVHVARAVADHLGLFDDVIASDGVENNKGATKADTLALRYGHGNFTYVGNSRADLSVWRASGSAVLINVPAGVRASARRLVTVEAEIDDRSSAARAALRAMRPYQWVKNLLVFVPIVTAHALGELSSWTSAATMFLAFCAAASGIYLINDLFDLSSDRRHARKRHRPLASGALPILAGAALAPALLAFGIGLGAAAGALWVILAYIALSVGYSVSLKEKPLVDVFILAALYTIRLVGGGVATGHELTLWLLAFSGFIFLSLAFVKRVEELRALHDVSPGLSRPRRGYYASDLAILQSFGCGSAFSSCIVLALFVQDQVVTHHAASVLLWGIVPLLLFWQCRLWLSTARGYMHDDPIIYAARDWVSWLVAIAASAILTLASFPPLPWF